MAETEQPMTLRERMALLDAAHVGRIPGEPPITSRPRPQVPIRRPVVKQKSFNIPSENAASTTAQPPKANLPSGPPPLPTRKQPPPLPARKSSQESGGRQTMTSAASGGYNGPRITASRTKSEQSGPRIRAPAWGECELPALPLKTDLKTEPISQTKSVVDRPRVATRSSSVSSTASTMTTLSNGSRQTIPPPPLPSRKSTDGSQNTGPRKVPPMPSIEALERARKASFASNTETVEEPDSMPPLPSRRPSVQPTRIEQARHSLQALSIVQTPRPVPRASRPDLSAIQATKPKVNGPAQASPSSSSAVCMICRDFSAPDHHATLFPRQHVTSLQTLAQQLTAPFPSLTDKARAIFTWLHHNIDYNVGDFFSGNLKSSTPESTLRTGLAVCEGYAALFTNLATYAGLESIVITGHGKGYGYTPLSPGAPLPPFDGNHAWNAVKVDNGEWRLCDPCWYSGHVQGANMPYIRRLAAERFTQTSEEFGLDHFPNNKDLFFLPNGRTLTWEEYIQINPAVWPYTFDRPTMFDNAKKDYSIGTQTVLPPNRKISVYQQGTVRFQFGLFCPHWTLEDHTKKGPPPVFIIAAGGVDGRNKHYIPLEHIRANPPGSGGDMWYADVNPRELGAPGEKLTLFAVTSFGNRQDARGLTVQEFKEGVGRTGMGFVGVAAWELV